MAKTNPIHPADLVGYGRLAIAATLAITSIVEAMHVNIARSSGIDDPPAPGRARGIAGTVYKSVRGATRLVGGGIDAILARVVPMLAQSSSSPEREAVLAALNGVIGDYLAETNNPLAISMCLRRNGKPLILEKQALAAARPRASSKLLVLVHGLGMNDLKWKREGHDHGEALARDLGYTPIYLFYNSGLHVSTNGRALAEMLEVLVQQWPVPLEEFVIIGHSMGGLVSRAAYHYGTLANHDWTRKLRKLIFLGTPHHGSPLERGGNLLNVAFELSSYTNALARLGRIRSAGITDLRYGNLLDEDWQSRDRFAHAGDLRQPVPLPKQVQCYAAAAATSEHPDSLSSVVLGDGLVTVSSALGRHSDPKLTLRFAKSRRWVGHGLRHFDLLSHARVYEQIRKWVASPSRTRQTTISSRATNRESAYWSSPSRQFLATTVKRNLAIDHNRHELVALGVLELHDLMTAAGQLSPSTRLFRSATPIWG
jgi:pimeloyl-ACP methyl ester carboxylesterase